MKLEEFEGVEEMVVAGSFLVLLVRQSFLILGGGTVEVGAGLLVRIYMIGSKQTKGAK